MKARSMIKTKGFTLIELIAVMVIIGLLMAILIPTIINKMDEADYKNAETFFAKNLQESMITMFGRRGSINGVTAADLQATGLVSTSEWGGNWTMGAACAARQCIITYPIGGPTAARTDENGNDLAAKLTRAEGGQSDYPHIVSAVYNAGADSLVVTTRVR